MSDYKIQPGDTLSKIAKKYGCSVKDLQQANGIKNANLIFAGKTLKIPGIDSDKAFDNLKGLTLERDPQAKSNTKQIGTRRNPSRYPKIGNGRLVPMYGIVSPKEEPISTIKPGKIVPLYGIPSPGNSGTEPKPTLTVPSEIKPLYGVPSPGNSGTEPKPTLTIPHEIKPLYGVPSPGNSGTEPKPTLTIPHEIKPLYGVPSPGNSGTEPKPTFTFTLPSDLYKPIYGIPVPEKSPDVPTPGKEEPPKIVADSVKLRAKAIDIELLKRRGADFNVNNPNGKAQFVVGDEDGEVKVQGDLKNPDVIDIADNTNSRVNNYKYRKITPEEIEAGKTSDGIPLTKSQFKQGETYYILESVINDKGESIRQDNHAEVYRLDLKADDTNGFNYDLIQEKGMDGYDNSSINYKKRR